MGSWAWVVLHNVKSLRQLSWRRRTAAGVCYAPDWQFFDRSPSGDAHRGTQAARLYLAVSLLYRALPSATLSLRPSWSAAAILVTGSLNLQPAKVWIPSFVGCNALSSNRMLVPLFQLVIPPNEFESNNISVALRGGWGGDGCHFYPPYCCDVTGHHWHTTYGFTSCIKGKVDAETKESTRKTEEKLDGRNKEGHERKKPKWRPVGR